MNSYINETTAKGAGTIGEGPPHGRNPSVRQRGPCRYPVTARRGSELSEMSAERSREVVRLFAAQYVHKKNGRV